MASPFRLRADGTVEARLSGVEVDVVSSVAEQVLEVLEREGAPSTDRLFPPAYVGDPDQQAEFESLTRRDLASFKVGAAKTVLRSIEAGARRARNDWRGELDEDATRAWLSVLNDARLVLGTSLAVTDETDPEPLPDDDPEAASFNLYLYLGGLEESLIDVLAARDVAHLPDEEEPWE